MRPAGGLHLSLADLVVHTALRGLMASNASLRKESEVAPLKLMRVVAIDACHSRRGLKALALL